MSKSIEINKLKMNLFVRSALNQDHAMHLAEVLDGGGKLPPILITRDYDVVDGRHRIEAHELCQRTTIEYDFVDVKGETGLIALAYKANYGGSLPPTRQDTEHTIALLLSRGEAKKNIADLLALPPSMARKYVTDVQSKMNRAQLQRAADSVTEGTLSVPKAAEKYDVSVDKLRDTLAGHRRKNKKGLPEMKRQLTFQYKSVSQRNAATLRKLIASFEDGDITTKQMVDVFEHLENLQKQSSHAVADWKKRFSALAATAEKGK